MAGASWLVAVGLLALVTLTSAEAGYEFEGARWPQHTTEAYQASGIVPEQEGFEGPALIQTQQLGSEHVLDRRTIESHVRGVVQQAVRSLAHKAIGRGVRRVLQRAHLRGTSPAITRRLARAAAREALRDTSDKVNTGLVEMASKQAAITVAKQQARKAVRRAAAEGASRSEQDEVAQHTASEVAVEFATVAHQVGRHFAKSELRRQRHRSASQARRIGTTYGIGWNEAPRRSFLGVDETVSGDGDGDGGGTSTKKASSSSVASKISSAASYGIKTGIADATAVAKKEAKKDGLSAAETKALEDDAPAAVQAAAKNLKGSSSSSSSSSSTSSSNAPPSPPAVNTGASATVKLGNKRISPSKAAANAKEKAKKATVAKYKKEADEEKKKVREALQKATKKEDEAASFVKVVSDNALKRGIDKKLSTIKLKEAMARAASASAQVAEAVKAAAETAERENKRLHGANEKVDKAGVKAHNEAHSKNVVNRKSAEQLQKQRETATKKKGSETRSKKQRANEAAHKAIAKVVEVTGGTASKKVARTNAAKIQETFVQNACSRKAQHNLRTLAAKAKSDAASKGLSKTAQTDAEVKSLKANHASVVSDIVYNTARRNSHVAAQDAKHAEEAKGADKDMALDAARKAWKKAWPRITKLCKPAATKAADYEVAHPGEAPKKIDQHKFVTTAVDTMKKDVSTACDKATKPIVYQGAKKASEHDADYNWQVKQGLQAATKVCNAATQLYTQNAAVNSKKMVENSFEEDATEKAQSEKFAKEISKKANHKAKDKAKAAAAKAKEAVQKKCVAAETKASDKAASKAASRVVKSTASSAAEAKAKAAEDKVYNQSIKDGLGKTKAKELSQKQYSKTKAAALSAANASVKGVAPSPPTMADFVQLKRDYEDSKRKVIHSRLRVKAYEARLEREDGEDLRRSYKQSMEETADRNMDLDRYRELLRDMRAELEHESAQHRINTVLLDFEDDDKAKRTALVKAVALGVRELHQMGGHLPSELTARRLRAELQQMKMRVRSLEAQLNGQPEVVRMELKAAKRVSAERGSISHKSTQDHQHNVRTAVGDAVKEAMQRAGVN